MPMHDSSVDNQEDVKLPRDPMGRQIVVVVAVALLTFLLTVLAVKVHQHFSQEMNVPSTR
jgi:hypothetical protein